VRAEKLGESSLILSLYKKGNPRSDSGNAAQPGANSFLRVNCRRVSLFIGRQNQPSDVTQENQRDPAKKSIKADLIWS
jgi:hypothetical protein